MRLQLPVQDSRVRGRNANPDTPPYEGAFDLRSGYVSFELPDDQRSVIRIGRQEMAFGEERLISGSNWTNTARTFDAVRATLQHRKLKLDVFASSVVNTRNGTFNDRSIRSNALYGLYGNMNNTFIPGATIEPFVLWRAAKQVKTESGSVASLRIVKFSESVGCKKFTANLDYGSETAVETGSVGSDSILSWAGHWVVGETFRNSVHTPRIFLEYNFALGDRDPKDGKEGTFDQLYPSGHDKLGLSDQVGWKNIHDLRSGLGGRITGKFSVIGSYHSWWRASVRDGLYNSSGNLVAKISEGSAGSYVGQEADVQAIYSLKRTDATR